jgi:chitin-binding protein
MVYTIWQASHLDQSYYFCSDIDFSGGGPTTPPPTTPAPTTPAPTTPPATTPPPATTAPPAPTGACGATYVVSSQWAGGFQGDVTVTAGNTAIKSWAVTLAYPGPQTVQQGWNATVTGSGSTVTATSVTYNGAVAAGARTSFGFIGTGTPATPVVTCSSTT